MARKGKSTETGYLGLLVGTGLTENGHSGYFGGGGNVLKLDCGDGCTNLVSAYFHLGTESDRCSISTHASKITTAMGRGLCLCLLKIFLGSGITSSLVLLIKPSCMAMPNFKGAREYKGGEEKKNSCES